MSDKAHRAAEIMDCATLGSCELLKEMPPGTDDYIVGDDEYVYIKWDNEKLAAIVDSEFPDLSAYEKLVDCAQKAVLVLRHHATLIGKGQTLALTAGQAMHDSADWLDAALSALPQKEYCEWVKPFGMTMDTYPNATFHTDCGVVIYQGAINSGFKFCPYCGREIKEVK